VNLMKLKFCGRMFLVVSTLVLLLLSQISLLTLTAAGAPVLDLRMAVEKQTYNVGDTVRITGNVTLDGVLQNDTLAAVEIDDPYNNPYLVRTVDTGNVSGRSWWIQILDFYMCSGTGRPQTVFSRGSPDTYFNLTIKNTSPANTYPIIVGIYIQGSNNTPALAYYPIGDSLAPLQVAQYLQSLTIPSNAAAGEARIYMSIFSERPKDGGYPRCPERSMNFSIETATPSMPQQPAHFNISYMFPTKYVARGNYSAHGATNYNLIQTAIDTKQFTVIGPLSMMTYSPQNPIVTQTVTFNGSASYDVNGTIIEWYWHFGDGTTDLGLVVTHVYEMAGNYLASLTVTDNDFGSNTTSRTVTVAEAWTMFHHESQRSGTSTSLSPVTNRTKWLQTIGPNAATDPSIYSSPAVTPAIAGNAVYIGSTNGTAYAFNTATGAIIWAKTPAPGFKFYSSPAFADGLVFIGSTDGRVYALNATTGDTKYSITTGGPVYSSVAADGTIVYVGSEDAKVYAFYTNGTAWWTSTTLDGGIDSSPALSASTVFVGTWNGTVYALNRTTGTLIWRQTLTAGMRIYSSPAYTDGEVFVGSTDNALYALNADSGTILWNITTGGGIYSSPAVADGAVFVGSTDGNVYSLDVTTGALKWSKMIGQINWSSPSVAEGKIIIGTTGGKLYALREEDGMVWWSYQTGGPVDSSPALLNETVYASSKDGKLYAFFNQTHNVAVTSVIPSQTLVVQNDTMTFYATLWNKGSFSEVVNLTAAYNTTVFNSTSLSLARGAEPVIQIRLNTTGVSAGSYLIRINATLIPPAVDDQPLDNTNTCQIRVEVGRHDLNVTNLTPSTPGIDPTSPIPFKSVIGREYGVTVYLAVSNPGNFTEHDVQVYVYWFNSTFANQTINSITIPVFANGTSMMFNFSWIPNNLAYGNYTISAYILPVYGEENRTNNLYVAGIVRVVISGDVSSPTVGVPDGTVNMRDINYLVNQFQTRPTSPRWNPDADVNNDGVTNMRDISIAVQNFNKHV